MPVKTEEQQALQGLHRVRSAWMGTRTARLNTLRGLLREFGLVLPQGPSAVFRKVPEWLEDAGSPIPDSFRPAVVALLEEVRELERRLADLERQLKAQAQVLPDVQRLMAIPGIGLLIATALVAVVGDFSAFHDGRHLAAWLGLTPRESSSGSRRHLGRISKRGNPYLRMLFIHGARAVLNAAQRQAALGQKPLTRLQRWAVELAARRGHNKAACALANKLVRIAFAVIRHGRAFDGDFAATLAQAA